MPTTGRRRPRGRAVKQGGQFRQQASMISRTDTEAESQQQQSSNRAPSVRDVEMKEEERSGQPVPGRGTKRPGRPPGKNSRGRGRLSKEARFGLTQGAVNQKTTNQRNSAAEGCSEIRRSTNDVALGSNGGASSDPSAFHNLRRRSVNTVDESSADEEMRSDVESEGENDVDETSEQQIGAFAGGSNNMTETYPATHSHQNDASCAPAVSGDIASMNFSFPVFEDCQGVVRARNAAYVLPIAIGTIAFWLGKRAPEKKCYNWVVYVRSPGGIDLSHLIRRVKFQLHGSFPHPERIVNNPPYELEETGWGEFDIPITIEFHDDIGPPVEMLHSLRLYTTSEASTKIPVINEKYEEIIFSEPPAAFFNRVRDCQDRRAPSSPREVFFPRYSSHLVDDCMDRINLVRSRLRQEARTLMSKAESKGLHIANPSILKLIEQSGVKDDEFLIKPTPIQHRLEDKTPSSVHTRTHLVIDADNPDMTLALRTDLPRKKSVVDLLGSEDRQKAIRTPVPAQRRKLSSHQTSQSKQEATRLSADKEKDHNRESGQRGETVKHEAPGEIRESSECLPGALAPSLKQGSKMRERFSYDNVSPSGGHCAERQHAEGFITEGIDIQVPTDSKGSGNAASLAEISRKESGSSFGAESGT